LIYVVPFFFQIATVHKLSENLINPVAKDFQTKELHEQISAWHVLRLVSRD